MKITVKREIHIERERNLTIRVVREPGFCGECQSESPFLTVEEAAVLHQTTAREIYRLTENNQIHAVDTSEGFLLVCLASLRRQSAAENQIPKREK